jgi:hypothetical protein
VVSGLGAAGLYLLTEALTGRRAVAMLSAVLYAVYPLLIWHAVTPDESALECVLLIAAAYAIVTANSLWRACAAGVCVGLAVLMRSTVLPLIVLAPVILWINGRRAAAAACLVVAVGMVSPMVVRTYRLTGTPWAARSGLNLFVGNSRYAAALLPDYTPDNLQSYAESMVEAEEPNLPRGASEEAAKDRVLTRMALAEIRTRPWQTLWLKARYVAYFFWPRLVPTHVFVDGTQFVISSSDAVAVLNSPSRSRVEMMAYTLTYCPVLVAAGVGIRRRRRELQRDAILWAVLTTLVLVHTVYFPSTRYTTPAAFVLLFYAAVGLAPQRWRSAGTSGNPV